MAGREAGIARAVGKRICRVWLRTSRFADVARLAAQTLTLGPDAGALYDLGWAKRATGFPDQALTAYQKALPIHRDVGNRAGEATTLKNIGLVYDNLGDRRRVLEYYNQALPIRRDVGDRAGEAVTRYIIAMIHRAQGALDLAITELEHVVDLDSQVSHPDLESDTAMLERVRQERAGSRPEPTV